MSSKLLKQLERAVERETKATAAPMLISSQRHLDEDVVNEKRESADYEVTVYPFEHDGVEYVVVVDGHHSLEAARRDGVEPTLEPARGELRRQLDAELEHVGAERWLENHYVDSGWYDLKTGREIF